MNRARQWQNLVAVAELEPGEVTPARLGARELAVYDSVDGIFVSFARCTHGAANLCDGYFDGRYIECPLHQGLFDARTGEPKAAPATRSLRMLEARVKDGVVQVLIASESKNASF